MWRRLISEETRARLDGLDVPFNDFGLDPFGISKEHLGLFYESLGFFYHSYHRVVTVGTDNVPDEGGVMLIGNHSGGLPADAGMVAASLFFDRDPPRHVHGMVEKFAQNLPFVSSWMSRVGQLTGLPEHAERLLNDGRVLMAFPEGVRGIGKLFDQRYQLVRFGTGFMRIALKTGVPIVPFAYVGGEEAFPTIYHSKILAKAFRVPYWPVPAHIIPLPLPLQCRIHYGKPLHFEGDGTESDQVIEDYVEQVKAQIAQLIEEGRPLLEHGGDA